MAYSDTGILDVLDRLAGIANNISDGYLKKATLDSNNQRAFRLFEMQQESQLKRDNIRDNYKQKSDDNKKLRDQMVENLDDLEELE